MQASHSMHSGAENTVCDIAIEAALGFLEGELVVVAEFHLDLEVAQRLRLVGVRHGHALQRRVVVLIGPLVDAHLLADQVDAGRRPLGELLAMAEVVDGDGRVVPVRDRPDDVLRAPGGVAAEEHAGLASTSW